MSSQIKFFIDLSDLTAIRIECKSCGASVTLPIANLRTDILGRCSNCSMEWLKKSTGADMTEILAEFVKAFNALQGALPLRDQSQATFALTFETKHNPDAKLP